MEKPRILHDYNENENPLCKHCNHFIEPVQIFDKVYTHAICNISKCEWEEKINPFNNKKFLVKKLHEDDKSYSYIYIEIKEDFITEEEMTL